MDTPILRAEHEEFAKRMESENQRLKDEDARQNKRLDLLEESFRKMSELTTSVGKLATNMESMVKIQEQQGSRLTNLEGRDGETWRSVAKQVITAIISVVVGFVFAKIGMTGG